MVKNGSREISVATNPIFASLSDIVVESCHFPTMSLENNAEKDVYPFINRIPTTECRRGGVVLLLDGLPQEIF